MHPWLEVANGYNTQLKADLKAKITWIYSNSDCERTWKGAREKKKYRVNCAQWVCWILRNQKILESGSRFWGSNGAIVWAGDAEKLIKKKCDVIHVNGKKTVKKMIADGSLKAGDIVMYSDHVHTNMYAGNGMWYDAGTCYEKTHGEGAKFTTWYGKTMYGDEKVSWIIRLKTTTPVVDKWYRVAKSYANGKYTDQIGAYSTEANAKANCKAGYKVFDPNGKVVYEKPIPVVKKRYRVQCGVFTVKDNCSRMVREMASKKIVGEVVKYGNEYVAQAGVFENKANADALYEKIIKSKLPCRIVTM